MDPVRFLLMTSLAILAGCGSAPEMPVARRYDLKFAHPSPYANYIQVIPGSPGAGLPTPQEIISPDFARYLRASTGCTLDSFRLASAIGNHTVPAGYLVPVACP